MIEEPPLLRILGAASRNRPTPAQIAAFQNVPTGFVADAMDGQGALTGILPLVTEGTGTVAGPALTADSGPGDILACLGALAELADGDVLVNAVGGWQGCAATGDRVAGMARNAGAAAIVTDGPMRDHAGLMAVGLPLFCTGLNPNSPFAKGPGTVGYPVQIAGRQVASGDMIVADRDGVVVVPFARLDAVIARLAEVAALEQALDAEVAAGLVVPDAIRDLLASDQVARE